MSTRVSFVLFCLTLLLGGAAIAFAGILWFDVPPADSAFLDFARHAGWFNLVNFTSNAFHPWRLETVGRAISQLSFENSKYCVYTAAELALFTLGMGWLLRQHLNNVAAVLVALALSATIFKLVGLDTVIVSAIAWLPWVLILLDSPFWQAQRRSVYLLLLALVSLMLTQAAGAAALIVLIVPLMRAHKDLAVTTVFLLMATLSYLTIPSPNIAKYPQQAHVVTEDGIPGHPTPLLGPRSPIPIIDRDVVRTAIQLPALLLLAWAIGAALLKQPRAAWGLTLALVLLLDSALLPESLSQIAPLATLSRIVPHLFFINVTPLLLVITALALTWSAPHATRALLPLGLIALMSPTFWQRQSMEPVKSLVAAPSTLTRAQGWDSLVISPSYAALKHLGFWPLPEMQRVQNAHSAMPEPGSFSISASSQPQLLPLILDRDFETRWSSSNALQQGQEWLLLRFANPTQLDGVYLKLGDFITDFPRAFTISAADSCKATQPATIAHPRSSAAFAEVISTSRWEGPLGYTPSGHPYFGLQSDVRIDFPKQITTRCLLIEQTGKASFDWSVAELRVLRQGQGE